MRHLLIHIHHALHFTVLPLVRKGDRLCRAYCQKFLAWAKAQRQRIKNVGKSLTTARVFATLSLAMAVFTYSLWPMFPKGSFYVGLALHFTLCYTVALRVAMYPGERDMYTCKALGIGIIQSLGSLNDEINGDPTRYELNDYLVLGASIAVMIHSERLVSTLKRILYPNNLPTDGRKTEQPTTWEHFQTIILGKRRSGHRFAVLTSELLYILKKKQRANTEPVAAKGDTEGRQGD